jgi:hypothetical protein
MGTKNDAKHCVNLVHIDDWPHQFTIQSVCEWIYPKGNIVKSAGVEQALGPMSLVPTVVDS